MYALIYNRFHSYFLDSKFIHGCATLLPERVDLVPFWLPQSEHMNYDMLVINGQLTMDSSGR